MILRRLYLRRFLGLADTDFEFAPGVNVIVGPNEAGKSTLRTAIRTVLYENPATTSSELRDRFRTWGVTDPPELVLDFQLDGRGFQLTKNFASRHVKLTDGLGRAWEQHKVVQERLVEVLGLANDKIFDATAHIAQTELERIHLSSISKELGRIIGGGGEDVAAAIRRLDAHVKSLERGSKGAAVKEPGLLVALERKTGLLRDEAAQLQRNAAEAERARVELGELTATRTAFAAEFAATQSLLERNREILRDEDRLAALKREEALWEQKVRDIEELGRRLTSLDRELEAATASGVPDEGKTWEARALGERLRAREQDLGALRQDAETPASGKRSAAPGWGIAVVGILAAAGGLITWPGPLALILVVLGMLAAAAGVALAFRGSRAVQLAALRAQERERRRAQLEGEVAHLREALAAALAATGCATAAEAEQRLQRYRDLVRERQQAADYLTRRREGSDDETIAERWKTVRRDIFGLEERLRAPEVAAKRMTPLQVQGLERQVREMEQLLTQAQRREMKLTVDLERLATDAEQLAGKEELLAEAEEALAAARRQDEVCREALAGLVEARRLAEVPLREVVEKRAGEYLAAATGGRYTRLAVEQETLKLSVWSPEAGDWVEAAEPHLSRGTVDLVYLAARLALVTVLTGGKHPPLLFDDPFITFDDHRRSGALALLRELSREYQVFLFTCSRYYDGAADRLIELPDRTSGPVGPAPQAHAARTPPVEPAAPQPAPAAEPAVGPLWEQR